MALRWLVLCAAMTMPIVANASDRSYSLVEFRDIVGWRDDDHSAALAVFLETCPDLDDPEWAKVCAVASQVPDPKTFFEAFFQPIIIEDGSPTLFTGYYEPELRGSLQKSETFAYPLYGLPEEASDGDFASRKDIEERQLLAGRNLELAWVDDPVEAFFLQVQGSGRVALPDGSRLRLGYAGKNGLEYRSIGQELVRRGELPSNEVSATSIRKWVQQNPEAGKTLLWHNPSYVFFRLVNEVPPELGPLGAMNRSITRLRTVAIDPRYTPLGAPVWVDKRGIDPLRRLMIAQDTGSAIKGAQRADIFYGTGSAAGVTAGQIKDSGRLITLLPRQLAFSLLPEERQ